MKQYRRWMQLGSAVLLMVLVMGVAGSAAAATVRFANGGGLSGVVTSPGGYPLPAGTVVKLFDPGGEQVRGVASLNLGNGSFSFPPVANGLYVLKAVPTVDSGYTQSLPKAVSVANAPVNVGTLALTTPQVSGTVLAPDGVTPVPAEVLVYLGDGQVLQRVQAPSGGYAIGGLPAGDTVCRLSRPAISRCGARRLHH